MNLEYDAIKAGHTIVTHDGFNKHIFKNGSREHVISFTTKGEQCSHKNCVINHRIPLYDESIFLD